jgi:hypothetical protein
VIEGPRPRTVRPNGAPLQHHPADVSPRILTPNHDRISEAFAMPTRSASPRLKPPQPQAHQVLEINVGRNRAQARLNAEDGIDLARELLAKAPCFEVRER